jgi:hypothetical protein
VWLFNERGFLSVVCLFSYLIHWETSAADIFCFALVTRTLAIMLGFQRTGSQCPCHVLIRERRDGNRLWVIRIVPYIFWGEAVLLLVLAERDYARDSVLHESIPDGSFASAINCLSSRIQNRMSEYNQGMTSLRREH